MDDDLLQSVPTRDVLATDKIACIRSDGETVIYYVEDALVEGTQGTEATRFKTTYDQFYSVMSKIYDEAEEAMLDACTDPEY